MTPYLPNYLKGKNRKLIFDLFREKRELSRKEVVQETGMSFPTTIKSVNRLLELGILIELEESQPSVGAGRKGRLLRFQPQTLYAVGMEFEGRYANIGLVDLDGNVIKQESIELTPVSSGTDMMEAAEVIRRITSSVRPERILGIGIGFPAAVNPDTAEIVRLQTMNIRTPVPFSEVFPDFCAAVDFPIFLDNDVNMACTGEAFLRGKQEECRDLVYLSLGTGCGSAILIGGRLWRGNRFKSGEVGGFLFSPEKLREGSGLDFENRVNLNAVNSRFHVDLRKKENLPPELRIEISAYLAPHLSLLLYDMSNVLDIDRYVLSGIIPEALGEELFQAIQHQLGSVPSDAEKLQVEPSISENTGIVGAAVQVFDRRIEELLGE